MSSLYEKVLTIGSNAISDQNKSECGLVVVHTIAPIASIAQIFHNIAQSKQNSKIWICESPHFCGSQQDEISDLLCNFEELFLF